MINPLLAEIKYSRPLAGYSGAPIYLCSRDKKDWFVRKIAKDVQGSARLKLQVEKQREYAKLLDGLFETPEVLETGEIEGVFYADFEFINGADGAFYLRNAELNEVKEFAFKLRDYLGFLAQTSQKTEIHVEPLIQKVENLSQTYHLNPEKLLSKLHQLSALKLTETLYHGDFTFENLIFHSSGQIYLLDFLDLPMHHYWMDCSKLFQDLHGSWFVRNAMPLPHSTTNYLCQQIYQALESLDPAYLEFHHSLLLTNFMRILPYLQNESDQKLLAQRITHLEGLL